SLYNLAIQLSELAELSGALGSDIPFSVYGGAALASGCGAIIERLIRPPHAWLVLAKPKIRVSTKSRYRELRPAKNKAATQEMQKAIINEDYQSIVSALKNDLEEVTVKKYPEVKKLLENMRVSGSDGALMSGSGPTVFGICRKERQSIHLYNAMKGCCSEVYRIRLLG